MMNSQAAYQMTRAQAIALASGPIGYEPNDAEFSSLCALAADGGLSLSVDELRGAYWALTEEHGPIDGCDCEFPGVVCDLNALRAYVLALLDQAGARP